MRWMDMDDGRTDGNQWMTIIMMLMKAVSLVKYDIYNDTIDDRGAIIIKIMTNTILV